MPRPAQYPTPATLPGLIEFYHGTTLANAKRLLTEQIGVFSVPMIQLLDESEYTDFGKGFYIHPPENRQLSIDWAKDKARQERTDWGVLCVRMTQSEFESICGQKLIFRNKRRDRPHNAPVLGGVREQRRKIEKMAGFGSPWLIPEIIVGEAIVSEFDKRCNCIEFVEFNRHIVQSIQRPKDNDWTRDYSIMRGPIWVRKDSGLPGERPPFPEHIHQINLGVQGLNVINAPAVKSRRYVIDKHNENLPPP